MSNRRHSNGPIQYPPGAFPNAGQQSALGQQIVVNGGPLMNLDALICLTAGAIIGANGGSSPSAAVGAAVEIVAHATLAALKGTVAKRIKELDPTIGTPEFGKEPPPEAKPVLSV